MDHDFYERLQLLVSTLRRQRGLHDVPVGVSDPVAAAVMERVYDLRGSNLDLNRPNDTIEQVLEQWQSRRTRSGAEITVIAPRVNEEQNLLQLARMETRHVGFHLIDADLRWDGRAPNPRVVLRWSPGYRTTPSGHHRFAIRVRDELARSNPAAAAFDWSYTKKPRRRITWGHQRRLFAVTDHEQREIATGAEWLVDGVAHLKAERDTLMRRLGPTLAAHGCQVRGREITAPWGSGPTEPAVKLLNAYHDVVTGALGYGRYEPDRRPAGS